MLAASEDQTIVAVDKRRATPATLWAAVAVVDDAMQPRLASIEVDYEDLPAVTNLDEGAGTGCRAVHELRRARRRLMGQHYETPKEFSGTNLFIASATAKATSKRGLSRSHLVFEDTFTFPRVQHFSMEPHATVADVDEADRITLWAGTQEPSLCANISPKSSACRSTRSALSCLMSAAAMAAN